MGSATVFSFALHDQKSRAHGYLRSLQSPDHKPQAFPHEGQAHLLANGDDPRAFVAVFEADTMLNTPKNTAILGFYEAISEEDGVSLLTHVEQELRQRGIETLIGPMNQNTWSQYRFALPKRKTDPEFSPHSFFGDVTNHESYPTHFESRGFEPVSYYESRANFNLNLRHNRRFEIERNLAEQGIHIQTISMKEWDVILREIFSLSLEGFSNNKFYAPINFEYFRSLYQGIEPFIDEDFFLLARNRQNQLVGFIFAYPDSTAAEKRVVLKSMTIDKTVRGMGLGLFLMEEIQRIAYEKHFDIAIHALMYVDNTTKGISEGGMGSVIFRRYALYGKKLSLASAFAGTTNSA